jgi:hypothetical protein
MNPAYFPAIAALGGSIIGGVTSLAAAWITQNRQAAAQELAQEKGRRQKLYKEFIEEASKLYGDALAHNEADVSELVSIHALLSRMRVLSNSEIIESAENVVKMVFDAYFEPNRTFSELREIVDSRGMILLRDFSEACRNELRAF